MIVITETDSLSDHSEQIQRLYQDLQEHYIPTDSLDYWRRHTQCSASISIFQRIFSVCRLLTSGRRNRMNKSLEMCVAEAE